MSLQDLHGREINYLRLSVTDRCNLRCSYCMPPEGMQKVRYDEILSYEELLRIAAAAVSIGVKKIRITGGEPLLRKDILDFLTKLSALRGLERLVLTTNGILLGDVASQLRDAGVESLNISLDSLRRDVFTAITRGGELQAVLRGIKAAERAGFRFIKINVVVMRGINDGEIEDFASLTMEHPYSVRFIEYMPTLQEPGWESLVVPGEEILDILSRRFSLEAAPAESIAGPAQYHRIDGAAGVVGVITPISCCFCSSCNRIRVTSKGVAKSCLFGQESVNLRPFLGPDNDTGLIAALRCVAAQKPDQHRLTEAVDLPKKLFMVQVGG